MTENDIVNSYAAGRASAANQRLMAYCGVASLVVLLVGMWVIAGFVPPPGPNQTVGQIVAVYTDALKATSATVLAAFPVTPA